MDILLTSTAHDGFGPLVLGAAPGARLLRMQADGRIVGDDGEVARDEAKPEVAWATSDLFDPGAPTRPFFGLAMRSQSLRWLQSSAAGTDAPVFGDLVRRGVRLTTSHVQSVSIAEHVLRVVLDHYQGAEQWHEAQRARRWDRRDFREVAGTRWLVVGLGSIGAEVSVRARAFGATVTGVRRNPVGDEPVDEMIGPDDVASALPEAEIVVLAAPATAATRHMVDEDFLGRMGPGSVLVNVGRGALVDEEALLRALDRGVPDAALLDVFATEPLPADHPLWVHPRVTVTPHASASGAGRYARAADLFAANLEAWVRGEPLRHEVTAADLDR
ncbi:MAG: D-3-phosphoglycerate dehydrogenase [uncultured Acidimicrobiales bacterium]|uniref:D-3-phosphoglycerate dehydrogenase n=1 Tax=uncultured Acidimicrobiales bacterium TaxID=310071 RepID=A0A6J4IKS5_9ACTN|nr:MAG: D-3-phosphoglycerate dehydrogenase [uncultured Acidimicrobiales bacterium]